METQLINSFIYGIYGDTIGKTASSEHWNDYGEFLLILTKCLLDEPNKARVTVDYERLREELKLWKYYSQQEAAHLVQQMENVKAYRRSTFYWEDQRGFGISRVMMLFLANKNLQFAREEAFKQIIYTHRHPQVILTGLLIIRILYILSSNQAISLEEMVQALKDELMGIQRMELERLVSQTLPPKYVISFEREKIQYLMGLDRLTLKNTALSEEKSNESKGILLQALRYYFSPDSQPQMRKEGVLSQEALLLACAFCGLAGQDLSFSVDEMKEGKFIETMGEYILKLRNYQVQRKPFVMSDQSMDLFALEIGQVVKHPILNRVKVVEKNQDSTGIHLLLATKGRNYRLTKA